AGDDTISGAGGNDQLLGGAGNDHFHIGDQNFALINGETGTDVLHLAENQVIDIHAVATKLQSIECIDLRGGGNESVSFDAADVLNISETGILTILGDAQDEVKSLGQGWVAGDAEVVDGHTFNVFIKTVGITKVLVDQSITHYEFS